MGQYIEKSAVVAEMEARYNECSKRAKIIDAAYWNGKADAYRDMLSVLDSIEVKEVNEIPATVMVNKYGNRFISSWPGLKEYDGFKKGQEIKIVIPKK